MDQHVVDICKNCYFHTRALHHMRASLSDDVARTVACSIVQSRLDYCNALFTGMSEANLSELQRVQNTLTRVVLRRGNYKHITPALSELHCTGCRFGSVSISKLPRLPSKKDNPDIQPIFHNSYPTIHQTNLSALHPNIIFRCNLQERFWHSAVLPLQLQKSGTVYRKISETVVFRKLSDQTWNSPV